MSARLPSSPSSSSSSSSALLIFLLFIPATLSPASVFYFQQHSVIQAKLLSSLDSNVWERHAQTYACRRLHRRSLETSRCAALKTKQMWDPDKTEHRLRPAEDSRNIYHLVKAACYLERAPAALLKVEKNLQIKWNRRTDGTVWPWPKFLAHAICL